MQSFVGTSGFSYAEWRGVFYPEKLPASGMLRYYAEHLPAVEINNTFYRMPKRSLLEDWAAQTPEAFRFVLKASRRITHQQKLKDAEDSVAYLASTAEGLGQKLGPFLFQLPPFFKKDLDLLRSFLAGLPRPVRAAFEFRNATWFGDDVYGALADAGAALCGGDVDEEKKSPPLVRTASWGYLRLRRSDYAPLEVERWARAISDQGFEQVFAFFKHEERGPEFAATLNRLLA